MFKKSGLVLLALLISTRLIAQDNTLVVVTHDSFSMSEERLAQFEAETGIAVEILRGGDSGQMLNQLILTKDNPLGDMVYGIDNTFLSRGIENEIFIPYVSAQNEFVQEAFQSTDDNNLVSAINYGDVCINYDIAYFEDNNLDIPQSLDDLLKPEYRGLLVVQNPASSSPGLAFLLTTIAHAGTEGESTYINYWQDLIANDTLVVDGWETAYFTYFSGATEDGEYPMVVSYASSPPFTINPDTGLATTASIVADGMCFRQIEYAGILVGTQKEAQAQQFIDFMLSEDFQAEIFSQMYVFPIRDGIELSEDVAPFVQLPEVPAVVAPELIELNRDEWILQWIENVMR
jgi:thiamine transport system substrate-binding protein